MATLSQARVSSWAARWLTDELNALARVGNWEGAKAAVQRVEEANLVQLNVFHYTTVISACGKAGQLDEALSVLNTMRGKNVEPNVYTYTALINACSGPQRIDVALRLYAEMRLKGVLPNVKTMTALVATCSRCGRWEKAFQVLKECEEQMVPPNVITYTAAMDGCRRAGVCQPAIDLLLSKMREPHQVRPNEVTYNTLLGACKEAKDHRAALGVYARMVADGFRPVPYTKALLAETFHGTLLDGAADDLAVMVKPGRQQIYTPDSDPATAARAVFAEEDDPS